MVSAEKNIAERLTYYRRKYELSPRSRAFAPLADLLRKLGRIDEALPLLLSGQEDHPRYDSALVILGRCHLDTGQTEAAREAFRKVLELDPDNLVVLKLMAEDAARQENWSEATGLLERVVTLDPSDEPAEARLEQLLAHRSGADTEATGAEEPESPPAETLTEPANMESDVAEPALVEPAVVEPTIAEPTMTEPGEPVSEEPAAWPASTSWDEESDATGPVPGEEIISLADIGEAIEEAEHEWAATADETSEPKVAAEESVEIIEPEEKKLGGPIDPDSLATRTLADIYLSQGYQDKALAILRKILERQPERDDIRARILEIETGSVQEPVLEHKVAPEPELAPPRPTDVTTTDLVPRRRQFETWIQKIKHETEK